MLRMRLSLSLSLLAALLWCAPAMAQTITNPDERLSLAGEYIGTQMMVRSTATHCNYVLRQNYGPDLAVETLKAYMNAEEGQTLDDYLLSDDFQQRFIDVENAITATIVDLRNNQGLDKAAACERLLERVLSVHSTTQENLARLR